MTFTRRPPPAEVGGRARRLKGCKVALRDAPVGRGCEVAAVRPGLPRPRPSLPAAGQPLAGAPSGRGGNAGPGPGPMWTAGLQSPTTIRVTCILHRPSGAAVPAPARAGEDGGSPTRRRGWSARSRRPRSESPASCTDRAGRQCQSPARAGEGGGSPTPATLATSSQSPTAIRVTCVLHRPAGRQCQSPARADEGGGSPTPARHWLQSEPPASCTVRAGRHCQSPGLGR